ncbi:MAG TPA: transglycosylase, partial [Desulfosporosinus sp.]|nr:transglycosylase [Desulfosporosinus sp.]
MDVAQMFLLFQLQQMNASWKTPKSDQTGSSEAGETG